MAWVLVNERLPQRSGYYAIVGKLQHKSSREQIWFDLLSKTWKPSTYPIKQWDDESYMGVVDE